MNREQWTKGLEAWSNIKKQALIDIEQADIFMEAIENKLKSLPEDSEEDK